ncbi:MAG: oligosaccharide flippase family protein [Flavobacteriales bacterium]|nr:oligosaccharide flippase family protein [Flavobacteriales bacterium]MCB9204518.1 oligosaccharide flippase family protein [Flavobacteriales bacterium]
MINRIKKIFDSESKALAKNSSWLFLSTIYQAGIAFVKSVVIARSLGVEQYGTYAVIFAFVSTIQEIFNLNFASAFVKYATDYRQKERLDKVKALIKVGYLISVVAGLLSIIVIAAVTMLAYSVFFDVGGLHGILVLFAAGSSLAFLNQLARAILRVYDKFKVNSFVNVIIYSLEFATICFSLYFFKNDLIMLIINLTAINVVSFVLLQITAYWEVKEHVSGFWSGQISLLREDKKTMTNFLLNDSLSKTLQKMMKKGDVLILAAFADSAQVGLYDVARKLAFSLLVIKDPLSMAIYPQIARLITAQEVQKIRSFLRTISLVGFIPFSLGMVILFLFSNEIIGLLFGPEFLGSSTPLFFLVLAIGLEIVFFWAVSYILSLGRTGFRLRASLVSSVVTVTVAFGLVHTYGAAGIAFAILIGAVLLQSSFLLVILRHLQRPENG